MVLRRACLLLQIAGLLCTALPGAPAPVYLTTEVRIHPVDEAGRPLRLLRAELFLNVWGDHRHVPLVSSERGAAVPLDRFWLCTEWPERCNDSDLGARVILQADGYVPVVSALFAWLGMVDPATGEGAPRSAVEIRFPGAAGITITDGESKEVGLKMRRGGPRMLRIVDPGGRPIPAVEVKTFLFLSMSSHCGGTNGEVLSEGSSGSDGELLIPDADMEYAFEFSKAHYVLQKPKDTADPMRLIRELTATATTVVLRPMEKRPLFLEITNGELPGTWIDVSACVAACPCGACCGLLGVTDRAGRLTLEDFYPDEIDRVMVVDSSKQVLWEGKSSDFPSSGPVKVDLSRKR
jgi:hypothetical protein